MATVYLHIGMPKTGTSALQRFLAVNRPVLETYGLSFPDLGFRFPGRGENRNGYFLLGEGYTPEGAAACEWKRKEYHEGIAELARLGRAYSRIILSDEGLWWGGRRRPLFWPELKKDFEKAGLELRVIVYLRRQDDFVQSRWAQVIKEGQSSSFEDYIRESCEKNYPLDYAEYLSKIGSVIGKENVLVRVYERGQFAGEEQTIFSDFLDIFGRKMTDGFEAGETVNNLSLEGGYTHLQRYVNLSDGTASEKKPLSEMIRRMQSEDVNIQKRRHEMYFASEERRRSFMDSFAESNSIVAREYLGREDGRLFYQEETKTAAQDRMEMLGDLTALLGEMEQAQQKEYASFRKELQSLKREMRAQRLSVWLKNKFSGH
ncbi:MAG: hypothetical protein Q4B57_02535 [Eubacteriales bacterium]|nr:hypothetical protein [Eubacteriales bacterium]